MKRNRHDKIIELINTNDVETQEDAVVIKEKEIVSQFTIDQYCIFSL